MIREPYNLNPYNSTIDTSKVNNFSFTFSGDELGSWNIEIAKNNTSPEIVYTSEEFVPEDVGYTHIYDGDIVEGITLPSTIAHSQGDDGLLRRLYSINGYPFNTAVVKLNVNEIENIGNIKGSTANGYLVATNYSLGRAGDNVTIAGFDKDGTAIGSQITDGTYDFLGYLLSVKKNSNIKVGQVVQIEDNSFIIGNIEDAGDGYSELTIVNGEASISDVTPMLTFDSLAEADVTELTVGIEPVQDLNGYDKPWVGGAGKNLLPYPYYETSTTRNGVTFTVNTDGTVTANGTATGLINFTLNNMLTLSGNYILSGCPSGGSAGTYRMDCYWSGQGALIDSGSGIAISPNGNVITTRIVVFEGVTLNNAKFYPMIRLASETDPTWQPYSNICPITGHDEVTVTRTGKNLVNVNSSGITGAYIDVNGEIHSSNAWSVSDFVPVLSGENYVLSGLTSHPNTGVDNFIFYDGNRNKVGKTTRNALTSFAIPSGVAYVKFSWKNTEKDTVMFEQGSTATSYEPYQGSTYTTSLGQTVYGGTLDMVTGVLNDTYGYKDIDDFTRLSSGTSSGGLHVATLDGTYTENAPSVCSMLEQKNLAQAWGSTTECYAIEGNAIRVYTTETTLADFKTKFAQLQIAYLLAEPVTFQLTAQQIKTLVGTNNVWASSGDIVSIKFAYETN